MTREYFLTYSHNFARWIEDMDYYAEDSHRQTLVEVARLYYEQNLTQTEIGRKLSLSRSTVSRMLQRARDAGIVTITVNYDVGARSCFGRRIESAFALREARVLSSKRRSYDSIRNGLGKLGANLLEESLNDNSTLGVSYGRSLANTVEQVRPRLSEGLTVVPVIGALGSDNPLIEGIDLTRQLATKLGARYRYLHAPRC